MLLRTATACSVQATALPANATQQQQSPSIIILAQLGKHKCWSAFTEKRTAVTRNTAETPGERQAHITSEARVRKMQQCGMKPDTLQASLRRAPDPDGVGEPLWGAESL